MKGLILNRLVTAKRVVEFIKDLLHATTIINSFDHSLSCKALRVQQKQQTSTLTRIQKFRIEETPCLNTRTFEFSNFSCDENIRPCRWHISMFYEYFSQCIISTDNNNRLGSRDKAKYVPVFLPIFLELIQHRLRIHTEKIPQERDGGGPRG